LSFELRNDEAERLAPFHAQLGEFVDPGDDLILYKCPTRHSKTVTAVSTAASSVVNSKVAAPKTSGDQSSSTIVNKDIKSVRKELDRLFELKQYRSARLLCEEALKSSHSKDYKLFLVLSKISYENGNFDKSVEFCERAVGYLKTSTAVSGQDVTVTRLHYAKVSTTTLSSLTIEWT